MDIEYGSKSDLSPQEDILDQIDKINYNPEGDTGDLTTYKNVELSYLKKRRTYTFRTGNSITGKLVSIRSSVSFPQVLVDILDEQDPKFEITGYSKHTYTLDGTLFGTKSYLGVYLKSVVDIK